MKQSRPNQSQTPAPLERECLGVACHPRGASIIAGMPRSRYCVGSDANSAVSNQVQAVSRSSEYSSGFHFKSCTHKGKNSIASAGRWTATRISYGRQQSQTRRRILDPRSEECQATRRSSFRNAGTRSIGPGNVRRGQIHQPKTIIGR